MDCRKARELLTVSRGELDSSVLSAFDQHLSGCAECRLEAEAAGRVEAALAGCVSVDVPQAASEAVLAAIPSMAERQAGIVRRRERRRRFLYAACAAAVALYAVLILAGARPADGASRLVGYVVAPIEGAVVSASRMLVERVEFLEGVPVEQVTVGVTLGLGLAAIAFVVFAVDLHMAERLRARLVRVLQ